MSSHSLRLVASTGDGPPVLLVHGVGVGAESFVDCAAAFADLGLRAHVLDRYAGPAVPLEAQVDEVAALLAALGEGPVAWVGVSGGATLGVLAALRVPDALIAAVVHEPLVGPLAPALHEQVVARAASLAASSGDRAALDFVRELVGRDGWDRLDARMRDAVTRRTAAIRTEVPRFAAFSPAASELAACHVPVTVTVGERSPRVRHLAVATAAAAIGGTALSLPGVGHLPQLEDAGGLAAAVATVLRARTERSAVPPPRIP